MTPALSPRERRVCRTLVALAVVTGAAQAWAFRHAINPDGISYLDIADRYARGDFAGAVNAYWSPLYSWLLAAAQVALRPSPYWEFGVAHLVNFLVYLAALGALEFFVRALVAWSRDVDAGHGGGAIPDVTWRIWAFAAFAPAALGMVTLRAVTPDLIVLAITLVVAGALCRVATGAVRRSRSAAFGLVLGAGYLAKTVMFPLGAVALVLFGMVVRRAARPRVHVALALAAFVLASAPFIAAVSAAKNRLTIGEAGRMTYIGSLAPETSVLTGLGGDRDLTHAPQRLVDSPPVYHAGTPIGGTIPLWYDPTYWAEGAAVSFVPAGALRNVAVNLRAYAAILRELLPLVAGLAIVAALGRAPRDGRRRGRSPWFLAVFALAVLAAYGLVHVERRFIGGAVLVLVLAALASIPVSDRVESRRLVAVCGAVVLACQVFPVWIDLAWDVGHHVRGVVRGDRLLHPHYAIAEDLRGLGVRPGDAVAVSGDYVSAGWARLLGARVEAVVHPRALVDACAVDDATRARVTSELRRVGIRAVVAEGGPTAAVARDGWRQLAGGPWYAYLLGSGP